MHWRVNIGDSMVYTWFICMRYNVTQIKQRIVSQGFRGSKELNIGV